MGLRSWTLRRVAASLGIDDDAARHFVTMRQLGTQRSPGWRGVVPAGGASAFLRAMRTRAAAQVGGDWVWPWWLERQLDPSSPAFVPNGPLPVLANVTRRNWTMVGNVASAWRAIVDERGLISPWPGAWSLDWWIGAEDRWHFPSLETAVRQGLVQNAPVVETAMRIPGGDAVERVFAVTEAGRELLVIEFENRSPVPCAVALAVRPYNPEGLAAVERISWQEAGQLVVIDGRPALMLSRRPAGVAASTFVGGDVADLVAANRLEPAPGGVRCRAGLAQAAFVYPLAHRALLRLAVPLGSDERGRRVAARRRRLAAAPELPGSLPSAEAVARGWEAQTERGLRMVLPEGRLAAAVEANRKYLLLFHRGGDLTAEPYGQGPFRFREAGDVLGALDRYGFHDEAAEILRTFPSRQKFDGLFRGQPDETNANGCAIRAIADHWRITRDASLLDELLPSVALGARWIDHACHGRPARHRKDPALRGLMPPGAPSPHLGPFDYYYGDNFWSLAGLRDAAELLEAGANSYGAGLCLAWAETLRADIEASLALVADRLGSTAVPAGPNRRLDAAAIGSLVACHPLGLWGADHPAMVATADLVRERFCLGDACFQAIGSPGLSTSSTLRLAAVELAAGDRSAVRRLDWLVSVATDTMTWPAAIHPSGSGGCVGDGHDGRVGAAFLNLVRDLLVREVPLTDPLVGDAPTGLALCSMLPDAWIDQAIEVHDAPTAVGTLSFAIRWHGRNPALLWELNPHPALGAVRLTVPGLDPRWSSSERSGEALLNVEPAAAVSQRHR